MIDGKTGPDLSRVVASAPKLAVWLDNHPLRNDKEGTSLDRIRKKGERRPRGLGF